jgi:GTP cyclohydrolase I
MAPFLGKAYRGLYAGRNRVVGISKLARVVEIFSRRRLQTQETLTKQIADAICDSAASRAGVAVLIDAAHQCMTTRGVQPPPCDSTDHHPASRGVFKTDATLRQRFLDFVNRG